jgi:cytochrome c oxidase assembly protein subunit 15
VFATRFQRFATAVLIFTVAVILWGAFVRASGSGAGCGSHWPTCNGEVIPRPRSLATIIEVTHRFTSGILTILILVQLVWALRSFPRGHGARRSAAFAMGLLVSEALIGAGLVKFDMVAANQAPARAAWVAAHLLNTFALLAALSLTVWRAGTAARAREPLGQGTAALLLVAMAGTLLVAVSGAIAALGDTLFPARSLAEGWQQDLSTTAHLFVRLRVMHPVLAATVGALLLALTGDMVVRDRPSGARSAATLVAGLVLLQLMVGVLNLATLAPIPLQVIHLCLADLVWIALVRLGATVRPLAPVRAAAVTQPAPS